MSLLEAGDGVDQVELHVERQAGRDAVGIELVRAQAFRFEEDLVRRLVGEAMDLVLDRRAVARTHSLDDARVERASIEAGTDDVVSARLCVGDPARHLAGMLAGIAEEGEHRHRIEVARLLLAAREVDGAPVDARRRAGFQAALRQLQLAQAMRERDGGGIAGASGRIMGEPHVHEAVQESARGEHDGACVKAQAELGDGAGDPVAFQDEVVDALLEQPEIGLVLQTATDGLPVQHAIGLGASGPDGRPLARVQDAELDAGFVGSGGHRAAQCVDLLDEVPLADSSDRRVARHLAERLDAVGEQQRTATHARRSERGFGAGVAATDDDDVELLGKVDTCHRKTSGLDGYPGEIGESRTELSPAFRIDRGPIDVRRPDWHQPPSKDTLSRRNPPAAGSGMVEGKRGL